MELGLTIAAAASPLTALVWVFAVSAAALAAMAVSTLTLAFRHRRRQRSGVYARILRNARSPVLHVLTMGDLLRDSQLREAIHGILDHEVHASDPDDLPPRADH